MSVERPPLLAVGALALALVATAVPAHTYPDTLEEEWVDDGEDACWRYVVPEGVERELGLEDESPLERSSSPSHRPRALLQGAAAQAGYDPAPPHDLGEATLSEALLSLYETQGVDVGLSDRVAVAAFSADLDPRLRAALAPLVQQQAHALQDHAAAFEGVTSPSEAPDQGRLVHAADGLLESVGEQQRALDALPEEAWPSEPVRDPAGALAVGSYGADTYTENRFLQVDPGGEDTYRNNAGGGFFFITLEIDDLRYQEVALHLDLGGDDEYLPSLEPMTNLNVAQGAGQDGIGIMVDWRGDDTYVGDIKVQGATFRSGVGVAWDRHGNDSYSAGHGAQGASEGGQSLLLDERGDDTHSLNFQGMGWARDFGTHAAGILADVGGDDSYDSESSNVVGVGTDGGLGLFAEDGEGADAYPFYGNQWAENDARWSHADAGVGCDDG